MFKNFYYGKRVLVTGHTGFKGAWLSLWLKQLGARVIGLSLQPVAQSELYRVVGSYACEREHFCDIRDASALSAAIGEVKPDVIFHLAAQALVRRSYVEPLETLLTNVIGTANLLESVRQLGLACPVLVVTSDKCYENREWEFAYRETDPLGGHDVYSASKAAAEIVTQSWRRSFFQSCSSLGPLATARAGNVIGGGDYSVDRIIPDCVRAFSEGRSLDIRNPKAVRPWQHVLECLGGYLCLVARLASDGKRSPLNSAINFGPDPGSRQSVGALVDEFCEHWRGDWRDISDSDAPHEANLLTLSNERAGALLEWRPVWEFTETVRQTAVWYRQRHLEKNPDLLGFTIGQINSYTIAARLKGFAWAQIS